MDSGAGGGSSCPTGQLVGAVLGTFFSTLALCAVLFAIFFVVYQRRKSRPGGDHLERRRSDEEGAERQQKIPVPPSGVQVYTNAGFQETEAYESHSTLPIRHPEVGPVAQSSVLPLGKSVRKRNDVELQESVVQITLAKRDIIGHGFDVRSGSNGGIFISQVLPEASSLLREVMTAGDEILNVSIQVSRDLSVDDTRTILSHTGPAPVKLTLRRRRVSQCSTPATVTHKPNDDTRTFVFRADDIISADVRPERRRQHRLSSSCSDVSGERRKSHELYEDGNSLRPTITRLSQSSCSLSADFVAGNAHPNVDMLDDESKENVSALERNRMEFHSLDARFPIDGLAAACLTDNSRTYRGETVESLPDRAQSLDDVTRHYDRNLMSSLCTRSAISADELRRRYDPDYRAVSQDNTDFTMAASSRPGEDPRSLSSGDIGDDFVKIENGVGGDGLLYADVGGGVPEMAAILSSDDETIDSSGGGGGGDGYVHVRLGNHAGHFRDGMANLERAIAAGRRLPDTAGLNKALRAKERASRGGMAYYVDLEQNFSALPVQQPDQQSHDKAEVEGSNASLSATSGR